LREVKPEPLVIEGFGDEIEELDLGANFKESVRVVDLFMRETGFSQQNISVGTVR
jgi:hypothetical protein